MLEVLWLLLLLSNTISRQFPTSSYHQDSSTTDRSTHHHFHHHYPPPPPPPPSSSPLSSSLSGITINNSYTEQSVVFDHNTVILLLVSWHMSALYISQGATFCLHPNLFFCHIYCVQTVVLFWLSVYYGRYSWYKFQLLRFRCH